MKSKIYASSVLIDIDGTLTYERNNYLNDQDIGTNYYEGILRDMLAERMKISLSEALEKVRVAELPCRRRDPFFALSSFGIPEKEFWDYLNLE